MARSETQGQGEIRNSSPTRTELPDYRMAMVLVREDDLPKSREARLKPPISSAQPLVQVERDFKLLWLAQCAFPDNCNSPAGLKQFVSVASIALHVGGELRLPEFRARGRCGRVRAPGMSMPKAAVHEAHGAESGKHQIRGAGQLAGVQPVSETAGVESPAQDELG